MFYIDPAFKEEIKLINNTDISNFRFPLEFVWFLEG
jgi:hypothetical protein